MSYRIAERSELQPDVVVMRDPTQGGRAQVDPDGYLTGAPELVIEVAVASLKRDLEQKRRLYERAGVQEYLVWEAEARRLHAWSLKYGRYALPELHTEGVWCSQAFAGLYLDVSALGQLDLAGVLKPYLSAR